MNDSLASAKADKLLELMISHQPNLTGTNPPLYNAENAKQAAQALAALRAELIEKLKLQP